MMHNGETIEQYEERVAGMDIKGLKKELRLYRKHSPRPQIALATTLEVMLDTLSTLAPLRSS